MILGSDCGLVSVIQAMGQWRMKQDTISGIGTTQRLHGRKGTERITPWLHHQLFFDGREKDMIPPFSFSGLHFFWLEATTTVNLGILMS